MGGLTLQRQKSQPINFGLSIQPQEGGRSFLATFDFSGGTATIPFSVQMIDLGMSMVQTLFIDNSNNNSTANFTIGGTGQKIACPPLTQGYFPCMFVGNAINLVATSAGAVSVPVWFMNTFVDPMLWQAGNPVITGAVTITGSATSVPLNGVYTDKHGALAVAGTSQILAAANGSRRRLFIQNPSTAAGQGIAAAESMFIDFTTAAGVANGISIELQPGQSFDTGQGPTSTETVNVNAATVGHMWIAKELN